MPRNILHHVPLALPLLVLVLCVSACSRFEIVQTTIQVPPREVGQLEQIERMAVIDFGSDKHPEIADAISNKLLQRLLDAKQFTLVERQKVKQVLTEQKFSLTEHVDPSTIAQAGKVLGVDHLLLGSVLAFQARDERGNFTDMESVQDGYNIIYSDGRPVEVPRWSQVPVQRNFKVRQVSVSISFRVVDTENATVRIADSITRSYTSQRAVDGRALPEQSQLLEDLLEQCISEIMTHFDYHTKLVECSLSTRKSLSRGNKYLRNGLLPEAVQYYRNKVESHPNSADAHYNLAVALEIRGELREAVDHYQKAFMQDDNCEIFQNRLRVARSKLEASR